ncbi:MAG: hypothetical protein ACK52I_26350 [Pseudomonadota bacterium]
MSQFERDELKNLQNELRERKIEALKLYRPNPNQEAIHACTASEILVIGGNRSGKSLCTFVEDARAVTGQDPYNKYPKENGVLVVLGKDWKHIGLVCYPLLMKEGAFKIIKDVDTGEWRAFNPATDEARRGEAKPAPPLIPKRMVKKVSWLLKSAGYCQKITLTNGWEIHFFSSEGEPVQGYQADRIHCDEDLNDERWVSESLARIVDRRGKFCWSAMPHSTNNALLGLKERADASEQALGDKSPIRHFKLRFLDNPFLDSKEKKLTIERWAAAGDDVLRMRAEGDFITDSVLVYPSFDMSIHGMDRTAVPNGQIPADWCRYAVIDPGHAVTAVLFAAVPPDGEHWVVYDQLYLRQCNATIFGEQFAKKVAGHEFHAFLIDAHGGRLRDIGSGRLPVEQYTEQLMKRGIRSKVTGSSFLAGCDDIIARCEATRTALHIRPSGTPTLRVIRGAAPDLEREIKRYRKQVNYIAGVAIVTDKPNTKGEVHICQCLEYLCAYRPAYHRPPVTQQQEPWWVKWHEKRKKMRGGGSGAFVYLGPQGGRSNV